MLAGCGRQADALAAIEAIRSRLAEELGDDPGEHLREAQLRVLRQQILPEMAALRRWRRGRRRQRRYRG